MNSDGEQQKPEIIEVWIGLMVPMPSRGNDNGAKRPTTMKPKVRRPEEAMVVAAKYFANKVNSG